MHLARLLFQRMDQCMLPIHATIGSSILEKMEIYCTPGEALQMGFQFQLNLEHSMSHGVWQLVPMVQFSLQIHGITASRNLQAMANLLKPGVYSAREKLPRHFTARVVWLS